MTNASFTYKAGRAYSKFQRAVAAEAAEYAPLYRLISSVSGLVARTALYTLVAIIGGAIGLAILAAAPGAIVISGPMLAVFLIVLVVAAKREGL